MLDTVIGTQPELGPAPPDGGYGWIILFGVTMIQITIPSILVTSGLLICHRLNDNTSVSLQDAHWMWLPTVYCAVWCLTNPWSVTLTSVVSGSCMGVTGIILVSSGLIAISLIQTTAKIIYILVGMLAGIGASMATIQSEYLLQKYFSSRLPIVHTLYQVGQAVGEMVMPVLIGSLLTKFGLSSTLLLQAGITLQALIGAVLFRKPEYMHTTQKSLVYTLLQNEDMEESGNNENTDPDANLEHVSNGVLPHKSPADTDDELLSDITSPDTSQNFNFHSSPAADSVPQPLFNNVELASTFQNTAFFIEDSDDDIDLYVQRGGFTNRTLPCSHELKVLSYPLFYCALILTAITKMSTMSFWILLPLLLKSRLENFQFNQAVTVLSVGGIANLCSAVGSHWLPAVSARHRKFMFIILSYIAAGGLYMLNSSFSWAEMVCAAVLIRLGTSGVTTLFQQVLEDTMGASEVIKIHTLLHTFTGLLIVLGMLMMSLNFTSPFNMLAGIQLGAGSLWCMQAIFNRLCNNR